MKLTWTISVLAGVGVLLVLAPYALTFPRTLSSNPEEWAAFGSYVGGTLSPYIAGLALVAFLKTLSQQQAQIEALELQATKTDLQKVIENIEKDYERTLRALEVKVNVNGKVYSYTCLDVVTKIAFPDYKKAMVNRADMEKRLEGLPKDGGVAVDDPDLAAMETFAIAAGHLNQLRLYVQTHDEISRSNALTKYYHRKHKLAYERFIERGILVTPWHVE